MVQKWGAAGLVALGVVLFSPKARQMLGDLINDLADLAVAMEWEKKREEAQRQAALLSEITRFC